MTTSVRAPELTTTRSDAESVRESGSHSPGRWRVFIAAFSLCFAGMMLWNLASPIGSVPDEPSHFIRAAAVARGQVVVPRLPSVPVLSKAIVPNFVAQVGACFAFKPEVPASCQQPVKGDPNKLVTVGQTAQANNPAFYAVVGLPSLVLSGKIAL
jgi:hypothetical protein